MPQVSWYLAAASLSSFSVPQSGHSQPSSYCLIVLLQLFFFDSSRYKLYFCLALLAARSNSLQATSTWLMPPTHLTWSQIILLATKVSACLLTEKPLCTVAWWCERTSNILSTFHNLLYMSLPAMVSCIRISTLDLTGSKFTKRSHSLSIMEAAYLGLSAQNFIHFTFSCYTAQTGAIQTSDVSCSCLCRILSRGFRNARLFASGYWTAVLFSSLATTAFRKFMQDRQKSKSC